MRVLLALFCVFAFSTSAYAECAWVHWWSEGTPFQLVAAYPTAAECIKRLDKLEQGARDKNKMSKAVGTPPEFEIHRNAPTVLVSIYLDRAGKAVAAREDRCLPDTVDPRGPKEK
jgi:hypothetical protein